MPDICPFAVKLRGNEHGMGCEVTRDTMFVNGTQYRSTMRTCTNYKKQYQGCPYYQKQKQWEKQLLQEAQR